MAGYTPVRADFDTGSVIVKDMLERLAFADLVVADVSLPNGNVYYEVGLRHVAHETGCILFAAMWSRQLFDIEQFTSVRYELADGNVPDAEAAALQETVLRSISSLKNSRTPWHEFISGSRDEKVRQGIFREFAERLSAFQADVRAARLTSDKRERRAKIEALRETLPPSALEIADVAIEMLHLVRDECDWQETLNFADSLPEAIARVPVVQEQRLLALGNLGQTEEAIASLEELMRLHGETPERLGLIGGRYKRLWRTVRDARVEAGEERASREERRLLKRAIEQSREARTTNGHARLYWVPHFERGMSVRPGSWLSGLMKRVSPLGNSIRRLLISTMPSAGRRARRNARRFRGFVRI